MSIPIYVINLARSPERRASMARQLDGLGLDYRFIDAIDGKGMALEDFTPDQYDRPARLARWGYDLRSGDIAVCLSHEKALRAALGAGLERVAIVEDDVIIEPWLPDVLEALSTLPPGHDYVRLYSLRKRSLCRVRALTPEISIGRMLGTGSGTQMQVWDRGGMEKGLKALVPVTMPVDVSFDRYWENGLRIFAVQPYPMRESGAPGTQPPLRDVWRENDARGYRWKRRMHKRLDSVRRRACDLLIRAGLA